MSVFLSELHYDNTGTDSGEFIEITAAAGTDLANYELYLYNGNDGTVYATYDLSGAVTDQGTGFGAITVYPSSLQNGSPDGLALVDAGGILIEFLSYEGSFVAVGGPADGITSIDIGVAESSSTPIGYSLQKQSGIWSGPAPASPAQVNEAASSIPTAGITLIHEIQADGFLSPLIGESVTIEAIVVGDFQGSSGLNGFYLQEEDGDADLNLKTSEGIFVFDGPSFLVDVNLGDLVRVTGTVKEFSELTELDAIRDIEIVSAANSLPTATVLRFPLTDQAQLEAVEGMRVTIPDRLYVTEYFNLDRFGEIRLASDGPGNAAGTDPRLDTFTQFNPPDVTGYAAHLDAVALRQILLDDGSSIQNPPTLIYGRSGNPISRTNTIRGGDHINDLSGILSQGFGSYRIQRSEGVEFQAANARPTTPPAVGGTLQVGSLNVLNLFATLDSGSALTALGLEPRGAESQEELDRQLEKLVTTIHTMDVDVLALVELENDFLPGSPGNALELLVQRLNATSAAGTYAWVMPTGRFVGDDAIAVGFLYKTAEVRLTPGTKVATLTDAILPDLGLSGLPPVFDGPATNRSPLAVTFSEVESGRSFTLVANHFKSKGSVGTAGVADEDALDGAGFANQTRVNAARALESWLATDPTGSGDPDVLVLGDLNAYAREEPIAYLEAAGFVNLAERFLGAGAYSFIFDGQSGTLDYALATPSLLSQISGTGEWHINADEPDAVD
jgi:predicted extracellular nuclease